MNALNRVGQIIQICERSEDVKNVRGLILSLAISGKLTSRESNREDTGGPFVIPSDWKWCALSKIAACRGSAKVGSAEIKQSDWVLDMEDIDGATGTIHTRVTFKERSSLSTKSAFKPGDVLYGKLRPYLNKVVLADTPGYCTTEIIPITPGSAVESRYLQLALRSPYFLTYATVRSYGMKMPRLGTKDLESSRIPLPPTSEQKLIVAKVDELMALCDRLEVQLEASHTAGEKLLGAMIAELSSA
jgi:type I restriction enzyme S subunit